MVFVFAIVAAVALLVLGVATRSNPVQGLDDRLEVWIEPHRRGVEPVARMATLPGEGFVHPVVAALAALTLYLTRGGPARRFMIPLGLASLGGIVAHHVVKFIYHRPRPAGALRRNKTEAAFPSGHTTNATAVLTTSAYLFVREGLVPAPIAVLVVVAICGATGVSRVALGWHWGSDVIGGWIAGIGIAAGCCLIAG